MSNHIEIENYVLPREDLAKILPDMNRFERCLDDARMLRDRQRDDERLPECADAWSDDHLADVTQTMHEYALVLDRIREIYSGPIPSLSTNNVCAACQEQALADHAANPRSAWTMTFTFCEHTSRSLILQGPPGKPNDYMASVPAPEWQLRAFYERLSAKFEHGFRGRLIDADGRTPTIH